jgi:pteridine reductase
MGPASHQKVALVTGAARRVGRAIAMELARAGCDVAVHYRRSEQEARQTATDIEATGRRAALIQADLTEEGAPQRTVDQAVQQLGGLRVLVNSASIWERTPLAELSRAALRSHWEVNLTVPALLAQAAWPHLRRNPPGHLINICDISGDRPWADHIAYCVSKAGLITLTRALAKLMAPDVFVNGISPGVVLPPEGCDDQTRKAVLARVPLAREGTPQDVAALVRFFVERNTYILGQIINVDGGRSIS